MTHVDESNPMLREPRKLPGAKLEPLSPMVFLEATCDRGGTDSEDLTSSFGLTEVRLDGISQEGITLMSERFQSLELMNFITRRGKKRPNYLVRFDYADAARGALDHIMLFEVDASGKESYLFRVPNIHVQEPGPTVEEVERHRNAQEQASLAIRNNAQLQLAALRRGGEARDRMLEAQNQRRQRQRRRTEAPVVSKPIYGNDRDEPVSRGKSTDRVPAGSRSKSARGSESDVPPKAERPIKQSAKRMTTGELLGGTSGFEED